MNRATVIRELCLTCGACCNGVLFRDVELQPKDDARRLKAAGLKIEVRRSQVKFRQPCRALGPDLRCQIYSERPSRCREFECALFKEVLADRVSLSRGLRIVREARLGAGKVGYLLALTGDKNEAKPLAQRFRRVQRLGVSGALSALGPTAMDAYAELTQTVHALNVLLSTRFYPGPPHE